MTPYAEVIGDPIAHSKSPMIHNFWLRKLGIEGAYRACHVRPGEVADYLDQRRSDADWRGCNVTLPHKIAMLDHVDDPGKVRSSIGAVNTVLRHRDGVLTGTNTDAGGFYAPLADIDLAGKPVAVIGTGGAARAVLFALSRLDVGLVTILARNGGAARDLLERLALEGRTQSLDVAPPPVALLINATSLGMTGQPPLDINLGTQPSSTIVYDLVYAPLETALLAAARNHGLDTIDGLEMLIGQAAVAFELFFGATPPRAADSELRQLLTA